MTDELEDALNLPAPDYEMFSNRGNRLIHRIMQVVRKNKDKPFQEWQQEYHDAWMKYGKQLIDEGHDEYRDTAVREVIFYYEPEEIGVDSETSDEIYEYWEEHLDTELLQYEQEHRKQ